MEEFTSPTPGKEQDEQRAETSSSKTRSQRLNKLIEEIHELEFLDREIKRNNDILTKRNKQLHNSVLEMSVCPIEKKESEADEGLH